jgi:hypothetical protein
MKTFILLISVCWFTVSIGQVPLVYETFDTGIPVDWTIIDNDGNTPHPDVSEYSDAWIVVQDPDDVSNFVVSSTSYFQPVDRADRWLITPNVTLGASGNFISWYGKSHDASFPDSYKVLLSTTGTAITDFTDTLKLVSNESPDWTYHELEIENFADENVHIAFVLTTFNGFKLYLDTINLRKEDPLFVENPFKENNIKIYPNPTSDYLTIQGEGIEEIYCHSTDGKLMFKTTFPTKIDVTTLPKGVYFLSILKGSEIVRSRFVKE